MVLKVYRIIVAWMGPYKNDSWKIKLNEKLNRKKLKF